MKLLKLTPSGTCSVVEIEEFDLDRQLDQMYRCIGCSTIEIVRLCGSDACLIVDEEYLIRQDQLEINYPASLLAGFPVFGNALVGRIRHDPDGDMITSYEGTWYMSHDREDVHADA